MDANSIHDALRQQVVKRMPAEIKDDGMASIVTSIILDLIGDKIDVAMSRTLSSLVHDSFLQNLVQDKMFNGMQDMLEREVKARAGSLITRTDLGNVFSDKIAEFVDQRMNNAALPDKLIPLRSVNLSGLTLSADKITEGTIKRFTSTGIEDTANSVQLTVMDDTIVIEGRTITNDLSVEQSARIRKLEVQDELKIKGTMVFENPSFADQVRSLVEDKLADNRENNALDLLGRPLYSSGKEVISESSLGAGIAFSNLRKVGNLQDLNVIGKMTAAGTVFAADGKVGINTEDPSGALTIWDEEAEITIKKYQSKTMFIGSTRDCDIIIGSQDKPALTVRKDGSLEMRSIQLSGMRITVSTEVPNYEGTPGEMVIMARASQGQPWAYQCLEGKKWAAMNR